MENPKDSESLAIDILTFLTGISSRDGEKFPVLRKAIRAVTNSEERGLFKVIEELRAEGTTISTSIADHIESFTDYDFAHLLFSDGDVTQSISLEKQLNIHCARQRRGDCHRLPQPFLPAGVQAKVSRLERCGRVRYFFK